MAGQPFVADPLAGLFYPPYLLLFVLPLPLAFNFLLLLHLAWLGLGMFQLMSSVGLSQRAAFIGGLFLMGTPNLIAHLGAGHITIVFAMAWIPWSLLAARRLALFGGILNGAILGSVLAILILLDLRWGVYGLTLSALYGSTLWVTQFRTTQYRAPLGSFVKGSLSTVLFTVALSMVLLLPFFEFIQLSDRTSLSLEEAGAYSLPPYPYLLGAVFPLYGVVHEWATFLGVVTICLAIAGLFQRPWFWIILVPVCLLYSLGVYGPLFPLIFNWVPGFRFLRAPSRLWLFVALGVCAMAAHGSSLILDSLIPKLRSVRKYAKWASPAYFAMFAICALGVFEILRMNNSEFTARQLPSPSPATIWLESQPGLFRVFSPSGSLRLPDNLQHVEGVSPVHLLSLQDFVARASKIPSEGYSVSVPAIWIEGSNSDNELILRAAAPDTLMMAKLNVEYIASEFELEAPRLERVNEFGTTRVYRNVDVLPRARIGDIPAEVSYWSPNKIEVKALGPGELILSEISHPGWRAYIDGTPVVIDVVDGLFRGLWLESGYHEVMFVYRPISFYTGLAISIGGIIALLGLVFRDKMSSVHIRNAQ